MSYDNPFFYFLDVFWPGFIFCFMWHYVTFMASFPLRKFEEMFRPV